MFLRKIFRFQTMDLKQLNNKFDVILIEPPLGGEWSWNDVLALDVPQVAQPRSFVFLWCGSSEGTIDINIAHVYERVLRTFFFYY